VEADGSGVDGFVEPFEHAAAAATPLALRCCEPLLADIAAVAPVVDADLDGGGVEVPACCSAAPDLQFVH